MAHSSRQKETQKIKQSEDHRERFPHNQHEGCQARLKRHLGGLEPRGPFPRFGRTRKKEVGNSAIPSSKRHAMMDRGLSPNSEELVMDTSQVVVGTSQEGEEAVGC